MKELKRHNLLIATDAFPILIILVIFTFMFYYFMGLYGGILPALLVLFTLYFFRNPERSITAVDNEIVSPADGVVMAVEEVDENQYFKSRAIKVSIFLSVFNVHINRAPIEGTIDHVHYRPGKFLPAFKSHASHLNERNYIGIRWAKNTDLAVLVVQITGFIARRIVCWVKEGEKLQQGQRFGMIKFGSCTEIYLPVGSEVLVEKGQKVKGGITIVGRFVQ
jgi:phosphatidylserine decarboxylase